MITLYAGNLRDGGVLLIRGRWRFGRYRTRTRILTATRGLEAMAQAVLGHAVRRRRAQAMAGAFAAQVLDKQAPGQPWVLTRSEVRQWVRQHRREVHRWARRQREEVA